MGLSTQVRNTARFVVFVVAVLAILALGSGTWWYFSSHYTDYVPSKYVVPIGLYAK